MEPVRDGVQEPPGRWHVVVITGLDLLPPVASGIGGWKTEYLGQPRFPVPAVVGESLA